MGRGVETGGCTVIVMTDNKKVVYGYGGNIGGKTVTTVL